MQLNNDDPMRSSERESGESRSGKDLLANLDIIRDTLRQPPTTQNTSYFSASLFGYHPSLAISTSSKQQQAVPAPGNGIQQDIVISATASSTHLIGSPHLTLPHLTLLRPSVTAHLNVCLVGCTVSVISGSHSSSLSPCSWPDIYPRSDLDISLFYLSEADLILALLFSCSSYCLLARL